MVKLDTYPIGSEVKIRIPKDKPTRWNPEMMTLIGQTAIVTNARPLDHGLYRYALDRWRWSWRHRDLELVKLPKPDPNSAFRDKKRGF